MQTVFCYKMETFKDRLESLNSKIDKTVSENLNLYNDFVTKSKDDIQDGREEVNKNKDKIKSVKPKT